MLKILPYILVVCLSYSYGCQNRSMKDCNETNALYLSRLYYLSNPINVINNKSSLTRFVEQNSELFSEDGAIIKLASEIGTILISTGMTSFNAEDYRNGRDGAISMGATPEMANKVGNNMASGGFDAVTLGHEFLWLAEVIPDAARGDWKAFNTAGTEMRKEIYEYMPLIESSGMFDEMQNWLDLHQSEIGVQAAMIILMYCN